MTVGSNNNNQGYLLEGIFTIPNSTFAIDARNIDDTKLSRIQGKGLELNLTQLNVMTSDGVLKLSAKSPMMFEKGTNSTKCI
jgi:glutamine cyclotransferase